jgi:endoglucanase
MTSLTPPLKLLQRLTNAIAVSGDEGEVRKIVLEEVTPLADEVRVDALGNVLATKRGSGRNRLKVMLAAHMDEVGLMVVADEGEGVYHFAVVGSVDASALVGKQMLVGRERIPAVIGTRPVHLMEEGDETKPIPLDSLRLDAGAAGANIKVGDRAAFATKFRRVGPSIFAKAIDDRIGVATLIEILKVAPANIDLLLAFTVQEEIALRGAGPAAHALAPDLAIAVESTLARDLPTSDGRENTVYNSRLGLGPAIYMADSRTIQDARLVRHFERTAQKAGIPYQIRQPGGGGNDAGAIHQQLTGIPSLSIAVPCRYIHSPVGVCRVDDWRNYLGLIHVGLGKMTRSLIQSRT